MSEYRRIQCHSPACRTKEQRFRCNSKVEEQARAAGAFDQGDIMKIATVQRARLRGWGEHKAANVSFLAGCTKHTGPRYATGLLKTKRKTSYEHAAAGRRAMGLADLRGRDPVCKDTYEDPQGSVSGEVLCADWASYGECDRNPGWMNSNCAKACGQCDPTTTTSTTTTTAPSPALALRLLHTVWRGEV